MIPGQKKKWCKNAQCPYFERIEVPYSGDREADIVIVGDSPGGQDLMPQQPFVGLPGQILNAVVDSIGYSRSTTFITNACRCLINKDDDSIKIQNEALRNCRGKLVKAIQTVKPKVVIAMGAVALKQLTGMQKITENRGRFFYSEELGCQVFVTVHPNFVLRGASREFWKKPQSRRSMKENLLYIDFAQVKEFLETGKTSTLDTNQYREGTDSDAEKILNTAKVVAVDFETTGLDLANPEVKVLCISICMEEGKPLVFFPLENGQFSPSVNAILQHPKISKIVAARPFEERVCHNKLGFDMGGQVHDVLVMAHLLDENYNSYGLEAIADIYTPLKGIKALAEGMRHDLESLPREKLIMYNAVDADATLRAFNVLRKILKGDEDLLKYYAHFIQKIQTMFADTYHNGGKIDAEQLGADEAALTTLIEQLHMQALALIPDAIKEDHEGKLKLSRNALVSDFLFLHKKGLRIKPNPHFLTPKTKKPQISEDHLKEFREKTPFIDLYLRMKKAEKILNTYISKIWECLRPDGRVYPGTILTRTVTGRTVMAEPTIQTFPTRGEFAPFARRAFVADDGWVFGSRDLGQSEIRVMGWQANDPTILRALRNKIDIHTMTACIVNKITIEQFAKLPKAKQKDLRQKAKGVNFGFLYGMSARSFRIYVKNEYGLEFTEAECDAIRQAFFAYPNGYYKLPEYHRQQEQLAQQFGYVRSPIGRLRRLPGGQSRDFKEMKEAGRQAINFPIQSFSSDLGLIGMYLFWRRVKANPKLAKNIKIMWFIHDAIYFQAKDTHFKQAMLLLKHCMEVQSKVYIKEKFGVDPDYPITSDGKKGKSWATMHDWEENE